MRQDLSVSSSIEINAGLDKVWKGLTDPAIIKEYLFGTETVTDWKPGSEIIFQGEYNGQTYRDKGVITDNKLNELISYTYWSGFSGLEDTPENYSTVTYQLKEAGNSKTMLTWTQQGYANEQVHEHSQSGMQSFLEKIKEVMER